MFRSQQQKDGSMDLQSQAFWSVPNQLGKQKRVPTEGQVRHDRCDGQQFGVYVLHDTVERCRIQRCVYVVGGSMGVAVPRQRR